MALSNKEKSLTLLLNISEKNSTELKILWSIKLCQQHKEQVAFKI